MPDHPIQPDDTPGPADLGGAPAGDQRALVLHKNGQRFVFRCPVGRESDLLNQLAALVTDPGSGLDWFDAAVLSHQMGQQMGQRLEQLRKAQ